MSDTARCSRTANGIHGASRPRKPTSTPGQRRARTRTMTVRASAAPSSTSVSVSPAKLQSSGNAPSVNQVSWAKTVGTPMSLVADDAREQVGEAPGEADDGRQRHDEGQGARCGEQHADRDD